MERQILVLIHTYIHNIHIPLFWCLGHYLGHYLLRKRAVRVGGVDGKQVACHIYTYTFVLASWSLSSEEESSEEEGCKSGRCGW